MSARRCYKTKESLQVCVVSENCSAKGCKINVPAGLAAEHLCIMHFTLFIENECAEMRRETALGNPSHERQMEFITKISGRGEALVNVATSGFPMSDELKARVLSTLLTLMNTRENMDRAAMRQSAQRGFVGCFFPSRPNTNGNLGTDVAGIERARDCGIFCAFDDGPAVGEDRHLVSRYAKA